MTDNDFHAARTELANRMAEAGAQLLDFMGSAGALAAIPNTAQYVVAGDPAAIRAQLDTVNPQRRMRHGDRPEQPLYFGPDAGQPRRWAALITSAGHGVLQEYGSKFQHAQPGQEVLEVAEILPGSVGASTVLTDERIPVLRIMQLAEDCDIRTLDDRRTVSFARAIEREIAAQAGQVAATDDHLTEDQKWLLESAEMVRSGGYPDLASKIRAACKATVYAGQVAVPDDYSAGLRAGLLEGASIVRDLYMNQIYHTGLAGMEERAQKAEQILIEKAEETLAAPSPAKESK